ncbi:MAG: CusA/CzcA family heavy metal efflux RND transporter [Chitinophagales bacterium]
MLNKIIAFSIGNKLPVALFTLALLLFGAYEVTQLPIDAVPDITNNQVQLITVVPALGATDVERLITVPLEQANGNIPHLKELRSFSSFGLSVITLVFEDDADVYWARQQIAERLQQVQDKLPKGLATPFLAPVTTGLGEIYQYVVRPEKGYEGVYDAMQLRTIQDWLVRKRLLGVKGVADVSSFGGLLKQYEIAVEPEKLLAHQVSMAEVFSAIEKNNQNTGGSYIEKGPSAMFVRTEGLVGSQSDIENIVVKNLPNGVPILIRDVAKVQQGSATRFGALTYNGNLQVSGAVVMMLKGANSNRVIAEVKKRIEEIKTTLPKGVTIEPFIDRTKMVNNAIGTVSRNLMEGALIVVFVLVLFLGNLRAGLLVASVIPLSMLFAVILMNWFGVSGNLMSLGALDFGLIVDGAVIIVEAVMHRLSHSKKLALIDHLSAKEMDGEVKQAASRMMNSAVFGQIIILIVYLPIFTLQGIEGKMFIPMAQTVAFALLGAFVLSLTYVPMMSALFLGRKISHQPTWSDKWMAKVSALYQRLLLKVLRNQSVTIISVISAFVVALFLLSRLGGEFLPTLPEGDFAVEARILPGSNLNASITAVSAASKILLEKFPEVERVVSKTGSSEVPTDPMPLFASDMIIVLKNRSEWTSAKTYDELEAQMTQALRDLPGVTFSFQFPVAMRFNELISGAKQDVVCKIFGEQMDTLNHYANQLARICSSVNGSSGLYVEAVAGLPQITVRYNRAALAQYGLNISDVNRTVNTAFAGESAGLVYEEDKRFDLVVRLRNERRNQPESIRELLIATPQGTQIPLNAVAQVELINGPNQIQRENAQRRIIVGFNVRGRDVQSMVEELQQKVAQQLKLPPGYHIVYGGAFENLEAARTRLLFAVPVALLLIFILLFFAFRSVKQGLLIYSAIPLSAIGGIFALAGRGMPFSISAGVGFIALFGVAVLNGIVLIAEFNRLKKEQFSNLNRIVIQGTLLRLRPVLMTAFVASLGFLPMALSHGEGAEVQRPLATVVIGGLLIATLLTLFVLPVLYIRFHQSGAFKKPAMLLFAILINTHLFGQTPITLQAAIDTALANNLTVKSEWLKSEYRRQLTASGINIPNTGILGEYGQINSFYKDVRIGVSQGFNFPSVYVHQKNLLNEEWKGSVLQTGIQQAKLKNEVTQLFYTLLYLNQKRTLLQRNDSLFASFQNRAEQRYRSGESNILEKSIADNQRLQISLQLLQLEADEKLALLQFQLLLNTATVFVPTARDETIFDFPENTLSVSGTHPVLQYWKNEQLIAAAATKLEQAKLWPDLLLSYNAMSMRGIGADNKNYNSNIQFHAAQLGINVPLFPFAQTSRIKAAKANEKIAANNLELQSQRLQNDFQSALLQYQKYAQAVSFFETKGLKTAANITDAAGQQFQNGNINYLEWALLLNQATTLKSDYIDAVLNRNKALADLLFYISK